MNGLHWVLQDFAGGGQRPRGVSPVAVYGYHTRLFSLAAPKLSCLTGISVPQIFESIRYEAYGPGGAALIVACLTDNRERTASLLRQALLRFGGHLGAHGSVSYLFNQVGLMVFPPGMKEGRLTRLALDAGPSLMFRLHLDLASLSIADFWPDGGASVRLVNDTSYLATPL